MRRRVPDAAMVYLMAAAGADAPAERRAAAKLLLECFRIYGSDDQIRECLDVTERAMPVVAREARQIAVECGVPLG